MIVTAFNTVAQLRVLTLLGAWVSVLGGLVLPWAIMLAVDRFVHHLPLTRAWQSFCLHLFAPGYNLFLVGILTAVPFLVLAVVILVHMGTTSTRAIMTARRRMVGLVCAGVGMMAVTTWIHVDVLIHPDAQGALAYFFLPPILLLLLPVGYVSGRVVAKALLPPGAS